MMTLGDLRSRYGITAPVLPALAARQEEDPRMIDVISHQPEDTFGGSVAILGVPNDLGVARNGGRVGASEGPSAMRRWLYRATPWSGFHDTRTLKITDVGDVPCAEQTLEDIHSLQAEVVRELLSRFDLVIVVGGGHDMSYPDGKALAMQYGPVGAVNMDAHADVRPVPSSGAHSGTPFRQLIEGGHLQAASFTEFGLQPFAVAQDHHRWLVQQGASIYYADDLHGRNIADTWKASLQHAGKNTAAILASFDLDGIAAAEAPGVSAPSVDGLPLRDVIRCAELTGEDPKVRLIDIAELNPLYDVDGRTARAAALLCLRAMKGLISRR